MHTILNYLATLQGIGSRIFVDTIFYFDSSPDIAMGLMACCYVLFLPLMRLFYVFYCLFRHNA